jgi:hypothetical protein
LAFASSYQSHIANNILVLMLDPWFNNLKFIWGYASLDMAMHIVTMHDCKEVLMPYLLIIYNNLTLTPIIIEFLVNVGHELGVLGPWLQLMELC